MEIRIRDQGSGFDPRELPDPRLPENLMKPNGRGILLMESFMDEIDFSFLPAGGTELTLRKRIAAADGICLEDKEGDEK